MKTLGEVLPWVLRGVGCTRAMWSGDTGSMWRGRPGTELLPPRKDQLRRGRTNSAGRSGPGPPPGQFSLCCISLCNGSNGFKPPNVSLLFSFLLPLCDDIYPYREGESSMGQTLPRHHPRSTRRLCLLACEAPSGPHPLPQVTQPVVSAATDSATPFSPVALR